MNAAIIALMVVHGALHLLGVAKAFGLASLEQLTHPISRGWGAAWAACAILLLASAAARTASAGWWWMIAAPALVLSQVVIVAFWADARAGTVVNVVLLVPVLIGAGTWRFNAQLEADVRQLAAPVSQDRRAIVDPAELEALPRPVAAWLERAGIAGRPRARSMRLTQRGSLQQSRDGRWMSFRAAQWFSVQAPGFVWEAHVDGPLGISLAARDRYVDGKGSMRIELLSLIPVVDAAGARIDQGAMVRFLAETMWFPSAALEPYIRWEPIDDRSARAVMRYGDVEAAGVFRFGEHADVVGFEARRYREDELEDWLIENDPSSFEVQGGVRMPTRSSVSWRNAAGETWTWLRLEVETVSRDGVLAR